MQILRKNFSLLFLNEIMCVCMYVNACKLKSVGILLGFLEFIQNWLVFEDLFFFSWEWTRKQQ